MTWTDIAKKLRLKSLASAREGVRSLEELGDPALFDAALEGVSWGGPSYQRGFLGGLFAADNADALVRALLPAALAVSERARALAATAEELSLRDGGDDALTPHLAHFTGLRTLILRSSPKDLAFLAAMPRLSFLTLAIEGVPDLGPLYALPPLEGLSLLAPADHPWRLAGLPARGWLRLEGGRVADLRDLPPLRELHLEGVAGLADTAPLPAGLESLYVSQCPDLAAAGGLPDAVALKRLTLNECPKLRRIGEPCVLPELTDASLYNCAALTSLAGLPGSAKIERAHLSGNNALPSLAGFPRMEGLTKLEIYGHESLVSLDGLPALPALEELRVMSCPALADLRALLQQPRLARVDLRYCRGAPDPAPLVESPSIRAVALYESGIERKQIPPAHRHRFTWAGNADLAGLEKQLPPAPVVKQERRTLAQLRSLLRSRDRTVVAQGLELLQAAGEASWFDALLSGASYEPGWQNQLDGGTFAGHMKPYGLTGLLALAPPESAAAAALRPQITTLTLKGMRADPERPLSPRFLAALENLSALSLERLGPMLDESPAWPQLAKLTISELLNTGGLGWLSGATGLRELTLYRLRSIDLAGLAGASALEELRMWRCGGVSWTGLAGHPALRKVDVANLGAVSGWEALGAIPTLEILHAREGAAPPDLAPFAGGGLRELSLADVSPPAGLSRLEGLRTLSLIRVSPELLPQAPGALEELSVTASLPAALPLLARLRRLTQLSLTLGGEALDDLPPIAGSLRILTLHGCTLRAISGLAAHPALEEVSLTLAPNADPAPLLALPALKLVRLWGGYQPDLRALEERGAQVIRLG